MAKVVKVYPTVSNVFWCIYHPFFIGGVVCKKPFWHGVAFAVLIQIVSDVELIAPQSLYAIL